MKITKVNLSVYDDEYKLNNHINKNFLANVEIVIDYNIIIKEIKLLDGKKGRYLCFPLDSKGKGIAFPLNEETRMHILNTVINEYDKKYGDNNE